MSDSAGIRKAGTSPDAMYCLLRGLLKMAVRVYYRSTGADGVEKVPFDRPMLLTLNHPNSLIDPFIAMLHIERPIYLTASVTLRKFPVLRAAMWAGKVIPIYRKEEFPAPEDRRNNVQSLAAVRSCLAQGGAVCIFPEGVSHSESSLKRLKMGAARIALDFCDIDGNPGGLIIMPAGLYYEARERFRSVAWMRLGEPLDVGEWRRVNPAGTPAHLTGEIEKRIRAVTLNFRSRTESHLMRWASQIMATEGKDPGLPAFGRKTVRKRVELMERLYAGYFSLRRNHPEKLVPLSRRVRIYWSELVHRKIAPHEVYIPIKPLRAVYFVLRETLIMAAGFPVATWGFINHFLPYQIIRLYTLKHSIEPREYASFAIFSSIVVFPVFYLLQSLAVAFIVSRWWEALIYLISLPVSGYVAILYGDRIIHSARRVHTFSVFLLNPAMHKRLSQEGRAIVSALMKLGTSVPQEGAGTTS